MTNEDGSLYITYNGEVYNHADYRQDLESRGHVYRTHCDTETILHLYEDFGDTCVEHLRGMFAFAIWDRNKHELFIARDRLGVKPLYYVHTDDGSLFFASEIKALLEARAVKPELNFAGFSDYLANHATSGEETLFVGVKRLMPRRTLQLLSRRRRGHQEKGRRPQDGGSQQGFRAPRVLRAAAEAPRPGEVLLLSKKVLLCGSVPRRLSRIHSPTGSLTVTILARMG
jgi:asparagine synthase (glutamine-hydrolysing)